MDIFWSKHNITLSAEWMKSNICQSVVKENAVRVAYQSTHLLQLELNFMRPHLFFNLLYVLIGLCFHMLPFSFHSVVVITKLVDTVLFACTTRPVTILNHCLVGKARAPPRVARNTYSSLACSCFLLWSRLPVSVGLGSSELQLTATLWSSLSITFKSTPWVSSLCQR